MGMLNTHSPIYCIKGNWEENAHHPECVCRAKWFSTFVHTFRIAWSQCSKYVNDDEINYSYFHNHHRRNENAEYAQPLYCMKDNWEENAHHPECVCRAQWLSTFVHIFRFAWSHWFNNNFKNIEHKNVCFVAYVLALSYQAVASHVAFFCVTTGFARRRS